MPPLPPHPRLCVLLVLSASAFLHVAAASGLCELAVVHGDTLYDFSLAALTPTHRHGALSEDGFYKVAVNDSVLWFQLCDQMIFNFDPPLCLNCTACGGPLRCGMQCSALVSNNIGGYDVCRTIGVASNSSVYLIDDSSPQKGVVVKMSSSKCSLAVSVLCDSTKVQVSDTFVQLGACDYATTLQHPSGCPRFISAAANGWGWLATLFMTILCLVGGYILIGAIYRYYFLGIRSLEAIPNLQFWISLPQRTMGMLNSLSRSLRGHGRESRASFTRVSH